METFASEAPWRGISGKPSEYVWALVCGMAPQIARRRLVLVLSQAFVDDSGSGGDSPYFVLSSLISTVEKWACFADEWQAALAQSPSIEYFKMSQAESLKDEFVGFTTDERDQKLKRLTDLVDRYSDFRFSHLIDREEYDEILRPVLPKPYKNPYLWAFNAMISGIGSLMVSELPSFQHYRSEPDSQIECVFDRQGKLEKRAGRLYDKVRGKPGFSHSHLIREPIRFENDRTFLPLQGADLLAWHVRRYHSVENEPMREPLKVLTSSPKYHEFIVERDVLDSSARNVLRARKAR